MKNKAEQKFFIELGSRLTVARKKNGIKQEVLAQSLGMSRFSIVNIEAGRQKPSVYLLTRISKVLNCTIFDIIPIENTATQKNIEVQKLIKKEITLKTKSHYKLHKFFQTSQKIINNES